MKKFLCCSLLIACTLFSFSSCKSSKGCGGGGWYGPRNLEVTVDTSPASIAPEIADNASALSD